MAGAGRNRSDEEPAPLEGVDADFGFGRRRPRGGRQGSAPDPLVGMVVGDVRIETLVGEGGMGRVYLGRQRRPDRAVAVKVIRIGTASSAVLRRFERESEALARLQHPGIAQIHSFGTCPIAGIGTPYFVMEYVAGARPITDHAASRGLSIRDRLELFRQVCDAVGHAHARGILHRDLKPGNILVDEEGRPKVIDFGVARHLDRDTILTTGFEDIGRLVGTIAYMAPEQFHADAGSSDVRADVYALGVVLFELLAGRPPFDLRRAVLAHAARVVLEEEPPPLPSVNRQIGRDIGHVVRKCLEKQPQRRYASVAELSADIGRFLQGEPVLARAWSPGDRLRRLWRRHTAALAFAAGCGAVIAGVGPLRAAGRWLAGIAPAISAAGSPSGRGAETVGRRSPGPAPDTDEAGDRGAKPGPAVDFAGLEPVDGMLSVAARRLDPADAAALAAKNCHLTVRLEEIDAAVATALAAHGDGLGVSGIRELADDVAAALAGCRGGSLLLDDVETLSRAACGSLARYRGWLNMNGVREWPEESLEAIAGHEGGLSIRLADISAERARVLARHRGHLYVVGVTALDAGAARELVGHAGRIDLWRAVGITPAAAAILRERADIQFPGR